MYFIDEVNYKLLNILFHVLPPRSRIKQLDGTLRKPSIPESINSVILDIGPIVNIDVKYQGFQMANSLTNAACPPIVGITDENKYFVIFEGIYFPRLSILTSLDLLFKIFFVFNVEYPKESAQVFRFFQKYFYEMKCEDTSSEVNSLIAELTHSYKN